MISTFTFKVGTLLSILSIVTGSIGIFLSLSDIFLVRFNVLTFEELFYSILLVVFGSVLLKYRS